jgi:broad specificity phosphatase PhoE
MKIFVVRHGETTSDVEDRFGGDYDDHLTRLGVKEATELAEKVGDLGIEVIFASPKIRAQETAKILQGKLKVEIITLDGFRERNQNGVLTGMKRSEAKEKYPELFERVKNPKDTIDGAEKFEDFRKRVVDSFNSLEKLDYKTVAVITHGGPIRRIYQDILGFEKDINIEDCAVIEINTNPTKVSLIKSKGISFKN